MPLAGMIVATMIAAVACGADRFAGLDMGPRPTKLHERILAKELGNGLRVVVMPDARTNLVAVGVHYEVGSSDDPPEDAGLAHYAEHVVFDVGYRGTAGAELAGAVLDENAMTMLDRTYFFATALDVELDRVLEAAARRLEAKCEDFDDDALARERDVVVEEAKQRWRFRWDNQSVMTAIWGANHPYAHAGGGTEFVDIKREQLCEFIARHYGPSSAVLVVTGNVRDEHWVRIRERFERIPKRERSTRLALPAPGTGTARVTVSGLERPTVVLVVPVPAQSSELDALTMVFNGARWRRGDGGFAGAVVLGQERARVLAIYGDVADAKQVGELERTLRQLLPDQGIPGFDRLKERARIAALTSLDGILLAGFDLAGTAARGQPMTRFRTIDALGKLTEKEATRWFDLAKAKTVVLLPEIGSEGTHRITEMSTSLHDLDVVRSAPGELPKVVLPRPAQIDDYHLANGMRVLLSPDVDSLAFDVRLVIETDGDALALQAAVWLEPDDGRMLDLDARKRIAWYRAIGAPAFPSVEDHATTFRVSSLSTFADWHVWHLAWTVLHGNYPKSIDRFANRKRTPAKKREPPSALHVVRARVAGESGDSSQLARFTRAELEGFRRSQYRPETSTLIVAGKFDVPAMRREVETLFGGWRGGRKVSRLAAKRPTPRFHTFVAIPAKSTTTVEIAIAFAPINKPARSERVARDILEQFLGDRLRVIREGLGVSYGVTAQVDDDSVIVAGSVEPAFAKDAAIAMMAEIARVREHGSELEADFARAKRRVLARALARPLGPGVRAGALERIAIEHRPLTDLDREIDEIRALDFPTFRRIAARELRTDLMLAAVRGEEATLEPVLRVFGATKIERLAN